MSNRTLAWIAGLAAAIAILIWLLSALFFVPADPTQPGGWWWGMPHAWAWGWPFMGLMMLGMVLFWVAVIAGIVLLVRWFMELSAPRPGGEALEILRQRYARGEIDREEFEARRQDLERTR